MATVIKCDRCNCYTDNKQGVLLTAKDRANDKMSEYDLCDTCLERVLLVINEKRG